MTGLVVCVGWKKFSSLEAHLEGWGLQAGIHNYSSHLYESLAVKTHRLIKWYPHCVST